MNYTVLFLPAHKKIQMDQPENLLKICEMSHVLIDATCAGKGICGKCKIQIIDGLASSLTEIEKNALTESEITNGVRLACQTEVTKDLIVMMPDVHGSSIRKKKMNHFPETFRINPPAKILFEKTEKAGDDYISAATQDTMDHCYGIALDIGTTTIVALLWNLNDGRMIDVEAATNPQSVYGSDVISRIQYCIESKKEEKDHTLILHDKLICCLNEMIDRFCERNQIKNEWIYDLTSVGNTTMSHLFLGKNPAGLAKAPFEPSYSASVSFNAWDMGFHVNPLASGYLLPNIAGHVGSDITAVMLATDLLELSGNSIVIDIGTNGEILVASDGKVLACSTAAGPAFEGACISCGMRAARGAIERVRISDDISVDTIENAPAVGICGSGLIDATAQLLLSGLMRENGNLLTKEEAEKAHFPEALSSRLYGKGPGKGIVLVRKDGGEDIVITQKDIREVQLAKGAILGGIFTLMDEMGFQSDEIDRILIAGAFGNYIDKSNAIAMGLLPRIPLDKVHSIGNAAGIGSSMALLSAEKRAQAEEEVQKVTHVELSEAPAFQKYYVQGMLF